MQIKPFEPATTIIDNGNVITPIHTNSFFVYSDLRCQRENVATILKTKSASMYVKRNHSANELNKIERYNYGYPITSHPIRD